jgi:hypothetical protein
MLNVHITIDPIILVWGRRGVINHIGGVMVCVLASSAVDLGFEPRSGQTKDYTMFISKLQVTNIYMIDA